MLGCEGAGAKPTANGGRTGGSEIVFELLEIDLFVEGLEEVLEDLGGDVAELKFLLGILADLGDPGATGGDVILLDLGGVLWGDLAFDVVILADETI